MPIPKPNKGEGKQDFIDRCAGNNTMNSEYPDQDQRLAICYSQWRKKESMENNKKIERISPYVKSLIKETGKDEKEIQKLWNKAKEIAIDTYGLDEKDFRPKHYKFMVDTVKEMLGLNEKVALVVDFVGSDKSAKEFIQETVIGADFASLWKGQIKPDEKDEGEINIGDEIDKATKPSQTDVQEEETEKNKESKKEIQSYTVDQLKEMEVREVFDMEDGSITMEVVTPNNNIRYIKAESREKAKEESWKI